MGWSPTEFANVVAQMRANDHKAVAYAISSLFDRLVAPTVQQVAANTAALAAATTPAWQQDAVIAIDTATIIDAARGADISVSVKLPAKLIAVGSDEATVAMLVNGTEVARVTNKMSLGVGLSINDQRDPVKVLQGFVPAGAAVLISTLAASSTVAAPSIVSTQVTLR